MSQTCDGTSSRKRGVFSLSAASSSKEKGSSAGFEVEGKRMLRFSKLGADCGKVAVSIDGEAAEVEGTFSADNI